MFKICLDEGYDDYQLGYKALLEDNRVLFSIRDNSGRSIVDDPNLCDRAKVLLLHHETRKLNLLEEKLKVLTHDIGVPEEVVDRYVRPCLKDDVLSPEQREEWRTIDTDDLEN